jgi:hypothetical protein
MKCLSLELKSFLLELYIKRINALCSWLKQVSSRYMKM